MSDYNYTEARVLHARLTELHLAALVIHRFFSKLEKTDEMVTLRDRLIAEFDTRIANLGGKP